MQAADPQPPGQSPDGARAQRGRPRRAPELSETRARLIRAGLIHVTEKGYSAVGLDEILKAAGVPKGSFYHHFRGKAEFGLHLIDAYDAYLTARLDRTLGTPGRRALDRLKEFTEDAERGMARHAFRRGCLVGTMGQEMGALPEEFRGRLTGVLEGWQHRTALCLDLARQEGDLAPARDPQALAAFFWIGWEGAVLRAKLERRAGPLRDFASTFFTLLQT